MPTSAKVLGVPSFVATMTVAQAKMRDLEGFHDAGEVVAVAGSDEAPRLTGALAASLTVTKEQAGSATITSPLVYAVPIHWGRPAHNIAANPFLIRAADVTESRWVDVLEKSAQRALNSVRGV
jgi:hypothetical protein